MRPPSAIPLRSAADVQKLTPLPSNEGLLFFARSVYEALLIIQLHDGAIRAPHAGVHCYVLLAAQLQRSIQVW